MIFALYAHAIQLAKILCKWCQTNYRNFDVFADFLGLTIVLNELPIMHMLLN